MRPSLCTREGSGIARITSNAEMSIVVDGQSKNIGRFLLRTGAAKDVWDFKYEDPSGTEITLLIGKPDLLAAEREAFKHLIDSGLIQGIPSTSAVREALSGYSKTP